MATLGTANERLPSALGLSPATVERILRALRDRQLIRKAKQGGGRGAVHLSSYELAYVMLALATPSPSEGPDAVLTLRSMSFLGTKNPNPAVGPPSPTLEEHLSRCIETAGQARLVGSSWAPESRVTVLSWSMDLGLHPPIAIIASNGRDGAPITIYSGGDSTQPPIRRTTVISGAVLLALAELWADSKIHQDAINAVSNLRNTSPARATSESNDAGQFRQRKPAPSSDQPRANGTECSTASDAKGARKRAQQLATGWAGHDPRREPENQEC